MPVGVVIVVDTCENSEYTYPLSHPPGWLTAVIDLGMSGGGLECHSGRVGSGIGASGPNLTPGQDQNKIPGPIPNSHWVGVRNF